MPRIPESGIRTQVAQNNFSQSSKTPDLSQSTSNAGDTLQKMGQVIEQKQTKAEFLKFKSDYNRQSKQFEGDFQQNLIRSGTDGTYNYPDPITGEQRKGNVNDDIEDYRARSSDLVDYYKQSSISPVGAEIDNYTGNVRSQDDLKYELKMKRHINKKIVSEAEGVVNADLEEIGIESLLGSVGTGRINEAITNLDNFKDIIGEDKVKLKKKQLISTVKSNILRGIASNGFYSEDLDSATKAVRSKLGSPTEKALFDKQLTAAKEKAVITNRQKTQAEYTKITTATGPQLNAQYNSVEAKAAKISTFYRQKDNELSGTTGEMAIASSSIVASDMVFKDLLTEKSGGGESSDILNALNSNDFTKKKELLGELNTKLDTYMEHMDMPAADKKAFKNQTLARLQRKLTGTSESPVAIVASNDSAFQLAKRNGDLPTMINRLEEVQKVNGEVRAGSVYYNEDIQKVFKQQYDMVKGSPDQTLKLIRSIAPTDSNSRSGFNTLLALASKGGADAHLATAAYMPDDIAKRIIQGSTIKGLGPGKKDFDNYNGIFKSGIPMNLRDSDVSLGAVTSFTKAAKALANSMAAEEIANGKKPDMAGIASKAVKEINSNILSISSGNGGVFLPKSAEGFITSSGVSIQNYRKLISNPSESFDAFVANNDLTIDYDQMKNLLRDTNDYSNLVNDYGDESAIPEEKVKMLADNLLYNNLGIEQVGNDGSIEYTIKTNKGFVHIPLIGKNGGQLRAKVSVGQDMYMASQLQEGMEVVSELMAIEQELVDESFSPEIEDREINLPHFNSNFKLSVNEKREREFEEKAKIIKETYKQFENYGVDVERIKSLVKEKEQRFIREASQRRN